LARKLTPKQKLFCKYYLINLNATDAAIKAGYSKKTATKQGSQLLDKTRHPHIAEYLEAKMENRAQKLEITADKVVEEIAKIAFANTTDFLDISEGNVVIKDLSQIDTTAIAGAEEIFDKDGIRLGVKLKFHDKSKNLDMLMRHLGQYKDKVELSVDEQIQDWLRDKKK